MADRSDEVSNGQRALWTFLFYMLVMPLIGAITAIVLLLVAVVIGQAPGPFAKAATSDALNQLGGFGVLAFVWCVIPSAFTAIAVVPAVWKHGTVGWFMAGACGVIAFTAAILIFPFPTGIWQPLLAFAAGLVAVICRQILLRGGIIRYAETD
ncbi:MAG: hypothetical protein AAF732_23150 [Pseudomonadota bacterium]